MQSYQFSQVQLPLRQQITNNYRTDEAKAVDYLLSILDISDAQKESSVELAEKLIKTMRQKPKKPMEGLMQKFSLSSEEGIALMTLAESLLRIPDSKTRDELIKDKISGADWKKHLQKNQSFWTNSAVWGLILTGKFVQPISGDGLVSALKRAVNKGGEPLIRAAMAYAMKLLGEQFVTGQTIDKALENAKFRQNQGFLFSFDMLGEAAMTQADAEKYFEDYQNAIFAIAKDNICKDPIKNNGISVKLSAIFPRYQRSQKTRVFEELLPKLKQLFLLAKQHQLSITIDAEESERLELSLDLFTELAKDPDLADFDGMGFVVQAYQKRAPFVIDYLIDLAKQNNKRFLIRLVKGAYWDSEIKKSQNFGFADYPVYTQKFHTDLSYLVCAIKMLYHQAQIFPQFATHNALTLATIYTIAQEKDYEFQCLHGMGESLFDQVVGKENLNRTCRIYAPVGVHETLLAYLVRRLLENGANSSFVNQIMDEKIPIKQLIADPIAKAKENKGKSHALIPLPSAIFDKRRNSKGCDLSNESTLFALQNQLNQAKKIHKIQSLTPALQSLEYIRCYNPSDKYDLIGEVAFLDLTAVDNVVEVAKEGYQEWQAIDQKQRTQILRKFADLLEEHSTKFIQLAIQEAGKTLENAIGEVREAIDFARYYAEQSESLTSCGVGVLLAISPWNFPLAIFAGQVLAGLAAGNAVIAKPAEQTSFIAHLAVKMLHYSGVPEKTLQLVLGAGDLGEKFVRNHQINGILFTGSVEVAHLINYQLLTRTDLPVFIAETGGQNAMIVDSSALLEQVTADVIQSAFDSAGQRCSALRILCLQEEIADSAISMIKGAMDQLNVGNPVDLATDIGPVIDETAKQNLLYHIKKTRAVAKSTHQIRVNLPDGNFVAPTLFELRDLNDLNQEVFGPILHVLRYKKDQLPELINQINSKGYALTHGIHSRINSNINYIKNQIHSGNIYINRNIIGAVVGVQPFGGHKLSGTGPKAGGKFYLQKLTKAANWQTDQLAFAGKINIDQLNKAIKVLQKKGYQTEIGLIDKIRSASLNQAVVQFKSITGEQNSLIYQAPKSVFLFGGDLNKSAEILLYLASNNIVAVVEKGHPLAELADSYPDLVCVSDVVDQDIVLLLDNVSPEEKVAMVLSRSHDSAILRFIDAVNGFDFAQIYQEISISENTTAAGGNASLMAKI